MKPPSKRCSILIENVNSCPARTFDPDTSALRRLETSISPPVDLTAFTMSFYMESYVFPVNPYQIACYGDDGTSCALSVVIHANMTLEIVIASTRYVHCIHHHCIHHHFFLQSCICFRFNTLQRGSKPCSHISWRETSHGHHVG